MTPAVRRLLREHDLEATQIAGTGGGGRITREDVLAYVEAVRTGAPPSRPPTLRAAAPASAAPTPRVAGRRRPAGRDGARRHRSPSRPARTRSSSR